MRRLLRALARPKREEDGVNRVAITASLVILLATVYVVASWLGVSTP